MRLGLAALIAISLGCGERDRTCDPAVDFIYRDARNCHVLGLFQGGDFSCNASVRVCGHAQRDECPISR
jgi:hypothetical protein